MNIARAIQLADAWGIRADELNGARTEEPLRKSQEVGAKR